MYEKVVLFIECIFSIGMIANAALFTIQAIKIRKTKTVAGLSLVAFLGFNIIQMFSMLHGYIHNDKLLMFGFMLSFVPACIVTFQIFIYKKKS